MPPRKKARLSQAQTPTARTTSPEPEQDVEADQKRIDEDILNDPWTDEEEIGLYKGLIRWKPTGIHKHFRMLQLRKFLLENNYIHPHSTHTQIPGIWQKLESLYHLQALDEREDARQLSDQSEDNEDGGDVEMEDDIYSVAENKIHKAQFELPEEEYGQEIWNSRLADNKHSKEESPPVIPELNLSEQAPVKFVASFSIEPEEQVTPTTKRRGRPPKVSAKPKPAAPSIRRSRRQAASVDEDEADASIADTEEQANSDAESVDEAEDGSAEEQEDNDDAEADGEATSEVNVPTTRGGRTSGRARGRGGGRGRVRGRQR